MKVAFFLVLVVAGGLGCRHTNLHESRDPGEAQVVALVVRSEPSGALVQVNKLQKTWTTPCDIADYSLGKGTLEVAVSLAGYDTVRTKARYDGVDPVILQIRLYPVGGGPRTAEPVSAPEPQPLKPPPAPPTVRLEPMPEGTRLKVTSAGSRIRIQARTVITEADKPGEFILPQVPPEKVVVEFLDPRTDAVIQSVEFPPGPAPAPKDPSREPAAAEADRVGEVKVVSKTYGVFVKLDPGLALQPGEEILIFRNGQEVARSRILKVTKSDAVYPDGAAQVQKDGSIQKGDEVRRPKP